MGGFGRWPLVPEPMGSAVDSLLVVAHTVEMGDDERDRFGPIYRSATERPKGGRRDGVWSRIDAVADWVDRVVRLVVGLAGLSIGLILIVSGVDNWLDTPDDYLGRPQNRWALVVVGVGVGAALALWGSIQLRRATKKRNE